MIITKTPFRMSFFGGGTDMEKFFRTYGGAVLSTTFDKYCYVIVRHLPRFFDYRTHLTYSKMEYVNEYSEIKNLTFKITDEELLNKTGGIVQGMSGSPIVQNGHIIGAVTHVIVDNPLTGYGIFITSMLENGDKIKER